ncbi:MAG: hypothetical protein OJF49_003127 [Ktedonobacterales bacterium]|jgi:DNA-binding response OmpR family regulator|nr:MAG: hypothetical protein OJF49_003127 [Ktedonobacterales bacterium]
MSPAESAHSQTIAAGVLPVIMVIDDSPSVRKIIEFGFGRHGIRVLAFPEGISMIRAFSSDDIPAPALLLLDIGLPRMNGYQVAQIIRANQKFSDMKIIMLTAHNGVIDHVNSLRIRASAYIKKPFRIKEVIREVCEQLGIPVPPPVDLPPA